MFIIFNRTLTLLLLLAAFGIKAMAQQEELKPLKHNHRLRLYTDNNPAAALKFQAANDTLPLPFIDDFSGTSVYPDSSKWTDKYVYINTEFPINPPSIGVATFDGCDAYGNAYDNTNSNAYGACDTLTSKPINLYSDAQGNIYLLSDSIWLTFFVERKGRGNGVELADSLVLQFYDANLNTWSNVWSKKGGANDTVFEKVVLKLTDAKWLANSFQFRFINYGSTTGMLDHWHIDFVMLQRNFFPYDNNINDIAFRYRSASFLQNYTSVPWNHFVSYPNPSSLLKTQLQLQAYNNSATTQFNTLFTDAIFQGNMSNQIFYHDAGNNNVLELQDTLYTYSISGLNITPNTNNEEVFYILNKMSNSFTGSGLDQIRSNDSIVTKQVFRSYYSYDDGSAEASYNITNTVNAKLAMRFDFLQPDTIRAVQIFWAQQYDNSSGYPFRLGIWSSLSPENLIYQLSSLTPDYMDTINGFATYTIPDTILILSGSVYIGMILNLAQDYGLGFDVNTNTSSHMFYNSTGSWFQTSYQGTFMIRPVFGDSAVFAGTPSIEKEDYVLLFPNPARNELKIVTNLDDYTVAEITDMVGRLVCSNRINETIDVSHLNKGIYLVRITGDAAMKPIVRKLIIE